MVSPVVSHDSLGRLVFPVRTRLEASFQSVKYMVVCVWLAGWLADGSVSFVQFLKCISWTSGREREPRAAEYDVVEKLRDQVPFELVASVAQVGALVPERRARYS